MRERVVRDVVAEHQGILEAVRTRRPDSVAELLRTHLLNGKVRTLAALHTDHGVPRSTD
ncbi:MAG: FCD domain-containing protein [Candidatus Moduliflexus flocculans]|nr:FCD domain-containing protein [Candidatus Moduliflexus flocculans]